MWGRPYQKQSKTEQTLDSNGNVTQTKLYGFGSLVTPAKTYTNTYLTGTNYTAAHVVNRLLTSQVTDGTGEQQLRPGKTTWAGRFSSSTPITAR